MTDLVIRGGVVVSPTGRRRADVAIAEGVVVEIGPDLPGARDEIDARGFHVLPGLIDVHVHFNEPGHESWEGAATGSRALAAGGGTLFFDMPLNSVPCTVTGHELDRKRAALEATSIADFALWGGLTPDSLPHMDELADRGVVGFKAFMCNSGLPEFSRADDETLGKGMETAARLGLPVAVHAESEAITTRLAAQFTAGDVASFLASRPIEAETEAIARVLEIARQTGARLHIVHVSSGSGVRLAAEARATGVDVSIETCPHYVFFTADDIDELGAIAKCAPPLRDIDEHEALWDGVVDGIVDIVASDHSPSEPAMKEGAFGSAWGGIAGVQSTLLALVDGGPQERRLPFEKIVRLTAGMPATRFGIERKGVLQVGNDADVVLFDTSIPTRLEADDLLQRHPLSPYIGTTFAGSVRRTIRRGETIFADGRITAESRGRFVRPKR